MSDGDATDFSDLAPVPPKRSRRLRPAVFGGAALIAAGAGLYTWQQVKPAIEAEQKFGSITYEVPEAPQLTAKPGETVYRIDPTKSSLTYKVAENFAGKETSTATGSTSGIAGDIAVNADDLAKSRVGEIVADVKQFASDNNLRDARLRQDFLESDRYPLARFEVMEIEGLDGPLTAGTMYPFTMTGVVTVKDESVKATFDATAEVDGGALTATATTEAKLSRFGAGPIRIAGLVSTSDDITLTLALTAYDPTKRAIPTTITGPDAKTPADAPSFAQTVQPILEANCAACHNTGKMGARHVAIDSAADARSFSDGLKTVTQLGYMPPWPASDKSVPMAHEMKLTPAEIDAIAAWSDAGGYLDVDDDTPIKPTKQATGPEPRQDLVLERPAYTGTLDNVNDYRCFVLDPEITEPTFMTGYSFLPDQVEVLHHAQVFHISNEQREASVERDGADGSPGWSCYSGPSLPGRPPATVPGRSDDSDVGFAGQSNLVGGWVPGQANSVFPLDSGVLLQPGDALVLQVHYHYGDTVIADRSTLALQLDPGDVPRPFLRVVNPLAPVEIPCSPEDADEPLCDRDAALRDNVRLYGPSGAATQAGLLLLCGKSPEDLTADFDGYVARSTCDLRIPEDGTIVSVLGHMHTLGSSFRLTLDADTPEEQILLDIPTWSFDWQMNYELAEPLKVKAGQPLRMDCSWDRRADPLRPPKYTVFAEGTEDEMCFGTYALIPDDQ